MGAGSFGRDSDGSPTVFSKGYTTRKHGSARPNPRRRGAAAFPAVDDCCRFNWSRPGCLAHRYGVENSFHRCRLLCWIYARHNALLDKDRARPINAQIYKILYCKSLEEDTILLQDYFEKNSTRLGSEQTAEDCRVLPQKTWFPGGIPRDAPNPSAPSIKFKLADRRSSGSGLRRPDQRPVRRRPTFWRGGRKGPRFGLRISPAVVVGGGRGRRLHRLTRAPGQRQSLRKDCHRGEHNCPRRAAGNKRRRMYF